MELVPEVLETIDARLFELCCTSGPDGLGHIMSAHTMLKEEIEQGNAAGAAVLAYQMAVEICKQRGMEAAEAIVAGLEREDAMAAEIGEIVAELKAEGQATTPAVVWRRLKGRCGQDGSCCISDKAERKGRPAIRWIGYQGNADTLTFPALRGRLNRLKATIRER